MERYDYLRAVKEDVLNYINENNIVVTSGNRDEVEQNLNDTLFTCDSVTGNNIAICTGYAPFGTKNKNARKVCERWEKLYYNYDFSQRKRMIKRFARELSKTINN